MGSIKCKFRRKTEVYEANGSKSKLQIKDTDKIQNQSEDKDKLDYGKI